MAIALNITDHWSDGKRIHVTGSFVFSGNYVTGGDTVSFNVMPIKSASAPVHFTAHGTSLINIYMPVFGTTNANNKLKISTSPFGTELAAGAYPASVLNDTVSFHAIFPKFI